jgi:hypothetical protein
MGTGYPTFYKALGTEFLQTLRCLLYPPTFYATPHAFSVGEWVCIGRPGTYWGDVGLVRSLSDEEEEERITVLLVPRITDKHNLTMFSRAYVRPPLWKILWSYPSLSTEPEVDTWLFGRERMTKDGMLLRSFAPWELRKDMTDQTDLYLLPEQDTHFRAHLPVDACSQMPPVRDPRPNFIRGERVQVAGHKAIIAQLDRSVDPDNREIIHDEMEWLYSETWQQYFYCHPSHILKHHTNCDAVFSFGANENVVVVACDYFKEQITITL